MQTIQTLKFMKKDIPAGTAGTVDTPAGTAFRVSSDWSRSDYWGMIKSRTGAFRMSYSVEPGLYAVGDPTKESDVFVSANYKLSFDIVRRELKGMNAWVLVLDTKSINVWCAAGKGTFGTDELVTRIKDARLDIVVSHRRVIVPQLGAVGVCAAEVQKKTGFRVSFGPVQARDISAYVKAGYKKTKEMRTIEFPLLDRLVLTPMELNPALKKFSWLAGGILLFFGLQPTGVLFKDAWQGGLPYLLLILLSVLAGAVVTPALLPFIPFRSFAIKGWIVGLVSVFLYHRLLHLPAQGDTMGLIVLYLFFPVMTSYIALQFTGATTFTGMTGVKKELKFGVPVYIGVSALSAVLLVLNKLREWRVL
jgi:acetyl-CoA decarbonylase/synthase complex subunit gamma